MTAAAEQWIDEARSLTQSSSVPLGVPIARHMDILLRYTQGRLLDALGALEKVLELHYLVEGQPDCGDNCCGVTDDECGECRHYWPCPTVTAIESVLGIEAGEE